MLKRYTEKRDFSKTPEPSGEAPAAGTGSLRFCVQKHAARNLHYDLRLELDGVLLSWAVPKGPSYDPADKHLAVHVEDHPIGYIDFEGIIPKGEYGGGEVIVWDEGIYSPDDKGVLSFDDREEAERRMREDFGKGKLSVTFRGHKLSGSWTLVKTSGKDQWLIIKHRDGTEKTGFDVTALDRSVRTGRTIEDVRGGRPGSLISPADVSGAVHRARLPDLNGPMAASEAKSPFSKAGWEFELKIDGIRLLARVEAGKVTLTSRRGNDATAKFPRLVEEMKQVPAEAFILDGEVVCYDEDGKPAFQRLMERFQLQDPRQIQAMESKIPVEYCVFDLIAIDGWDLRNATLSDRRKLLEQLDPRTKAIRVLDAFPEEGETLFEHATRLGFEGIVAKKLDSRYRDGTRSTDWIKIKQHESDEFFVVGWTKGSGNRSSSFGALILAEEEEGGKLRYMGNVGSGFSDGTLDEVLSALKTVPKTKKPFKEPIESEAGATWIEPSLVAEVRYAQKTREGRLRFPVFLHLRPNWDLPAVEPPTPSPKEPAAVQKSMAGDSRARVASDVEGIVEQLRTKRDEFRIEVEGEQIKISSPDKILWPAEDGFSAITKRDFLIYLARVGASMIPHLKDRPLAFVRFPDGIHGERFFQKHWAHRPDYVGRVDIWSNHSGADTEYLYCNNLRSLLWLGQIAALEIHPWYSRINPMPDTNLPTGFAESDESLDQSVLNYPDFMVVDLDPNIRTGREKAGEDPEPNRAAWEKTVEAAMPLRDLLKSIGLTGYPKTSGKTGLHVYIPIKRIYDYGAVRLMCETIGRHLLTERPDLITMEWKVTKRPAKIFFDHNQNVRGKTLVSIYSPRPLAGAPVSFPVTWRELEDGLYPSDFRIENVPALLEERGDLWASILEDRQTIGPYTG